jgi:hypothetical protein
MSEKSPLTRRSARANLTSSLEEKFPNFDSKELESVEVGVLNWVSEAFRAGKNIARLGVDGDELDLEVLELIEKPTNLLDSE